jgi:hypothetical protein
MKWKGPGKVSCYQETRASQPFNRIAIIDITIGNKNEDPTIKGKNKYFTSENLKGEQS